MIDVNDYIYLFTTYPELSIYKINTEYTKASAHISYCASNIIQIGLQSCAIIISDYCEKGQSYSCKTFNSPQLTKEPSFSIIEIEVLELII